MLQNTDFTVSTEKKKTMIAIEFKTEPFALMTTKLLTLLY